ncbi:hypothetical protein AVEN_82660-1 [Araneus ventricosus]|uniref:Uncharacterized protein n=1 Tax=Araneus ventricosus TaxID=182803 RepID=A0A4Y2VYD6_ARAVE|nr:hypothetical protein AVEN_82660-1 [Araneus ventricosus]
MGGVVFGKFLRTSNDIHHWLTRHNNSSRVDDLGFYGLNSELERGWLLFFKSTSVAATRTPFWQNLAREVRYGVSEFPEASGTPWIRHSDLAGIIWFSL